MSIKKFSLLAVLISGIVLIAHGKAVAGPETMADYTDYPLFMSQTVEPNVLIILDNSGSMTEDAYQAFFDPAKTYYGYFSGDANPADDTRYSYDGAKWNIDAAGDWSGNFLNWATMRRVDVTRKVLMGGLATSRTGGGNQTNKGYPTGPPIFPRFANAATAGLVPAVYVDGGGMFYSFDLDNNGNMEVWACNVAPAAYDDNPPFCWFGPFFSASIWIQKDEALEPDDFVDGNIAGLMQRVEKKARWGLEIFNAGPGGGFEGVNPPKDGGKIQQHIVGTGYGTNFITDIQNTAADTETPLAEALYTAAAYFAFDTFMQYKNADFSAVLNNDPFYYSNYGQYVACPKNFVLIITDGESSWDTNIPDAFPAGYPNNCTGATLKDCDGDGTDDGAPDVDPTVFPFSSDYLDDVALWAHTTDLRSTISGNQNLTTYVVYAFGNDPDSETLLKETAKNGAFEDSDGNYLPTIAADPTNDSEWDKDGDSVPDTYYQASDGADLEAQLMAAITDILKKASSGTAISVLATSASGEGNIYQAYFLPSTTIIDGSDTRDVTWTGHMLSLNIDANGHLRDGSNNCITFRFDTLTNQTVIDEVGETDGVCDDSAVISTTNLIGFNNTVWDAGDTLRTRDIAGDPRTLFTYDPGLNVKIDFTAANAAALAAYIDTDDGTTAHLTDPDLGDTDTLDESLINFINGQDYAAWRSRQDENGDTFKLGDIVHSTPSVVSLPAENYGLLYQDASYTEFYNKVRNLGRNTMVYVGANDGMLHAFDADSATGRELWGYIPFSLLPHLKWLADPNYAHVNYVDLKTKISDVQIFNCDGNFHVGSNGSKCWGTVLIGGLRLGGGEITDAGGTSRTSAYYALDITNPNDPQVLWEFTDPGLGFTNSYPAIVKVGTKWYALFGSGSKSAYVPDYEGNPTDLNATLFVVDMETGILARTFQVPDATSFFADPVAVDMDFLTTPTFSTDAVYVGETYWDNTGGGSWNSRMWRLVTFANPNPATWKMYNFYNTEVGQAIVSAPSLATDQINQQWLYFGTGKYYSAADKVDTEAQTMYGMREPCWNASTGGWKAPVGADATHGTCSAAGSEIPGAGTASVTNANLVNTSGVVVKEGGNFDPAGVLAGTVQANTFDTLSNELVYDSVGDPNLWGWYLNLPEAGERSLNKPTVISGLVLFTTFVPNSDICGFSGNSYINALFYTTGTAYKESIIGCAGGDDDCLGADPTILARTETASIGMASSIAVHMGREAGAQAYVQLSTGEALAIGFAGAFENKSGVISWRDL